MAAPNTHKRKIVVTWELQVTDEYWQDRHVKKDCLQSDIATYLACRVENDNEPGDDYWLRDTTVYFAEEYADEIAEKAFTRGVQQAQEE